MNPIKVSAVSYLNARPFIHGLENSHVYRQIELVLDTPSECARKLVHGETDLGLVPVAVLASLKEYHIVSDLCIGSDGPVKTVNLYSEVPVDEVTDVYLDYQSETSVALTRVLAKHFWHINPVWVKGEPGFEHRIAGNRAGVIIGDRAFQINGKYRFVNDLSQTWKDMTGLPFVFACWVSLKKMSDSFQNEFNRALQSGVDNMRVSLAGQVDIGISRQEMMDYITNNISYSFDKPKKQAMLQFLDLVKNL
jgi:chorismate dehydratase